jgi:hypothetical protein
LKVRISLKEWENVVWLYEEVFEVDMEECSMDVCFCRCEKVLEWRWKDVVCDVWFEGVCRGLKIK